MGFKITNICSNPLTISTGRILPGETVKADSIGDKEAGYQNRGWLRVIEDAPAKPVEKSAETKTPAKTDTKQETETK
jgi:hypothetical protein